ncbi:hypothetical protein [Xanthomonas sp. 3058]|uniref:hypothetical protein n=1 Tax=Xanthomonas sp. 3058 TaxID=3035314 RepID=UPI001621BEC4|nr:hypothetical protein [Xanthomonas sp. 3058]MBB5866540.1 hypothetical protein [Xanthomonas sp. 3058]
MKPHTLRLPDHARRRRRRVWLAIGVAAMLLVALSGYGCTAHPSPAEQQQQTYWRGKAERELAPGMSKAQVQAWAAHHTLRQTNGMTPMLMAEPVETRWPHFPCATTFTMISLTYDAQDTLASFTVGRAGICL